MVGCGKLYVLVIVYFQHLEFTNIQYLYCEIFKYCACASCTIQYTIGVNLTQPQQNPPLHIKMKIGDIEFEIEAQPNQIQTAVDQILATVTERLKNTNLAQAVERPAPLPRAETCRGVIQKLWEENYFTEPKSLDEVHSELARKGFHTTAQPSHTHQSPRQRKHLTRCKPRRYQYSQKVHHKQHHTPPTPTSKITTLPPKHHSNCQDTNLFASC